MEDVGTLYDSILMPPFVSCFDELSTSCTRLSDSCVIGHENFVCIGLPDLTEYRGL
jgi:hypothetical protein